MREATPVPEALFRGDRHLQAEALATRTYSPASRNSGFCFAHPVRSPGREFAPARGEGLTDSPREVGRVARIHQAVSPAKGHGEAQNRSRATTIQNVVYSLPERTVIWHGSSLDDLRSFPPEARRRIGYQLGKIQNDREPASWKPLSIVGPGVRELRVNAAGAFRVIYVTRDQTSVDVLHVFQKKSQRTSQNDLDMARRRHGKLL